MPPPTPATADRIQSHRRLWPPPCPGMRRKCPPAPGFRSVPPGSLPSPAPSSSAHPPPPGRRPDCSCCPCRLHPPAPCGSACRCRPPATGSGPCRSRSAPEPSAPAAGSGIASPASPRPPAWTVPAVWPACPPPPCRLCPPPPALRRRMPVRPALSSRPVAWPAYSGMPRHSCPPPSVERFRCSPHHTPFGTRPESCFPCFCFLSPCYCYSTPAWHLFSSAPRFNTSVSN